MLYSVKINLVDLDVSKKYRDKKVFTTEKLKSILENPPNHIGSKEEWSSFKDYLLSEITEEADRTRRIIVSTGTYCCQTRRRGLLDVYRQITTEYTLTSNYKDECSYLRKLSLDINFNTNNCTFYRDKLN